MILEIVPKLGGRPPVTGVLYANRWDHTKVSDLTKVGAKKDQCIKVMIEEIEEIEGGYKITLSRKDAKEFPDAQVMVGKEEVLQFKGVVTAGVINLRGFHRDVNNLVWLIRLIEFPLTTAQFTKAIELLIRQKYEGATKVVNIPSIMRALSTGSTCFVEKKGTKYFLTELGESECFGRKTKKVNAKENGKPIPVAADEDLRALFECKRTLNRLADVRQKLKDLASEAKSLQKEEQSLVEWLEENDAARKRFKEVEPQLLQWVPLIRLLDQDDE
jgi:hypothetical protein